MFNMPIKEIVRLCDWYEDTVLRSENFVNDIEKLKDEVRDRPYGSTMARLKMLKDGHFEKEYLKPLGEKIAKKNNERYMPQSKRVQLNNAEIKLKVLQKRYAQAQAQADKLFDEIKKEQEKGFRFSNSSYDTASLKNARKLLGLYQSSELSEGMINKAYKDFALKHHPDKGDQNDQNDMSKRHELMIYANNARDMLIETLDM